VILGVDYPILWGTLAFLLYYVPNIGSILATIPATLLALVQLGVGSAILTAVGLVVIYNILGNIVEPKLMGKGLGLSPLVVFISLVFWGWVLGPVGMVLSVPLTSLVKIGLESSGETGGLAIMLGSDIEKERWVSTHGLSKELRNSCSGKEGRRGYSLPVGMIRERESERLPL